MAAWCTSVIRDSCSVLGHSSSLLSPRSPVLFRRLSQILAEFCPRGVSRRLLLTHNYLCVCVILRVYQFLDKYKIYFSNSCCSYWLPYFIMLLHDMIWDLDTTHLTKRSWLLEIDNNHWGVVQKEDGFNQTNEPTIKNKLYTSKCKLV